jgi:hypothetical protein
VHQKSEMGVKEEREKMETHQLKQNGFSYPSYKLCEEDEDEYRGKDRHGEWGEPRTPHEVKNGCSVSDITWHIPTVRSILISRTSLLRRDSAKCLARVNRPPPRVKLAN